MKKLSFFILFSYLFVVAHAQLRKIPADVTDAFAARYPHATKVEWRDKLQYFEASFLLNGSNITANFSSGGDWESSERNLKFEELPDEVRDGFVKSKYFDWKKNSVSETQELGKPLQYRISVQKSGIQKRNLFFDVNGKLLKDNITL